MPFFSFAADLITKLVVSLATRSLADTIKDVKNQRRMDRLVADAVDRIIERAEGYLNAEKVSDARKEILLTAIYAKLQPLTEDPQAFFASDLDGARIYKACHPDGIHPQEIQEEQLGQFYSVLFPQIAHFLAGSRLALAEWQAEGFREEFKRLRQIAEEIRSLSGKVADLPVALRGGLLKDSETEHETLFRELAQVILNNLLLKLDLSPLRPERTLHGSLGDHFVVPAFEERRKHSQSIGDTQLITDKLAAPGARVVVHGGPGAGKTTWALWLQSQLLQADPVRLALVFRLREYPEFEQRSLLDLVRVASGPHLRDSLTQSALRQWFSQARIVVVLDGFDEIPEERREAVEKWARDLSSVAKSTAILITTRPLQSGHLERLRKPWKQWDLQPFDEERIVDFIGRWHRYLPEGELSAKEREIDPRELARSFQADPSLRSLSDTPLMLGTLLFVHHRDQRLPSGRVDLYERYIAAMLGLRDAGLGIMARSTKLTDKEKRQVLAHVAVYFHMNGVNEANDETMRSLVAEALDRYHLDESIDRLLAALSERSGLVIGPGAWSFTHKTVGEFLVAETICAGVHRLPDGRRLDRMELWANRHSDSWTAVLFFWAGKTSPKELEEFMRELLNDEGAGLSLALGLLDDQGYRLDPAERREMTLSFLKFKAIGKEKFFTMSHSALPAAEYIETRVSSLALRGLAPPPLAGAFIRMIGSKTLSRADIGAIEESLLPSFKLACLWQLSASTEQNASEVCSILGFDILTVAALRLGVICSIFLRQGDCNKFDKSLANWREHFPEQGPSLPFLILGWVAALPAYRVSTTRHLAELLHRTSAMEFSSYHLAMTSRYALHESRFDLLVAISEIIKLEMNLHGDDSVRLLRWIDNLTATRSSAENPPS